ncbi:MAG: T9SS type A sorting domain-containing protein [Phycisphaeraceae bacterium]|nr:T9SS type A sorting domain-containing protein [Phycisphaeraceae bacterium]
MKTVLGLFMSVCCVAVGFSQITITATDISSGLTVGNSRFSRADTLSATANIGTPGSTANVWNFGSLNTHRVDTLTSVNVAGTPYAAWFPGATHALRSRQTLEGITGTVYQYLRLGTSLYVPGAAGDGQTPFGTAILRMTNTPEIVFYSLPLTLGTTWNYAYVETLQVSLLGIPLINEVTSHSVTQTVDAFGTITLPGSFGTHQALRIRQDDRTPSGRRVSYEFIAQNGASVNVVAADTLQPGSGTINISPSSTTWSGALPTDVRVSNEVPSEFALRQNYPNPFNPSTTIEYQVAAAEFVSLKVYNLLGQEVATLVNELKQPGTYRTSWNADGEPSGTYFYRMNGGSFNATGRMIVVK